MRTDRGVRCAAALALSLGAGGPAEAQALLTLTAGGATLEIPRTGLAEMEISESGGITDIFLRLLPASKDALSDFTAAHAGGRLQAGVCGASLLEATIRTTTDSGTIYVANTTMVRAEALRALWHGRATCDTLDPEVFGHGE